MTVTIYHNPRCSKSRQTLELIRAKGVEPKIVDYLNTRPSFEEVQNLYQVLGIDSALPMIRTKEAEFTEAGLDKGSNDTTLIKAVSDFPKLLERPIVVTEKGARICRPPELVEEIL